ncbi:MAG: hypothetical protein AAFX44_06635 [Pseudomonadota bacterium]
MTKVVTCTKKLPFKVGETVKIYRPGDVIDDKAAATYAKENGFGRLTDPPAQKKARPVPKNKAKEAPQNKATAQSETDGE